MVDFYGEELKKIISEFSKDTVQGECNNPLSLWKISRVRQREIRREIVGGIIEEKK